MVKFPIEFSCSKKLQQTLKGHQSLDSCFSLTHNPFISFPFQPFIKGIYIIGHAPYHLASFPEVAKVFNIQWIMLRMLSVQGDLQFT